MLALINNSLESKSNLHTFINPYSYLIIRKNKHLLKYFKVSFDGILLSSLFSLLVRNVKRESFDMTSLAPIIFKNSILENKSIYFIGSSQKNIDSFIKNVKRSYPKLNIISYSSGYFESESHSKLVQKNILKINPDLIVCGMGTPIQENFLLGIQKLGWSGNGYTCGGFIHQTAGNGINYYPKLINMLNLRWFYRLINEPQVAKRLFIKYPIFLLYFIFDFLSFKFSKPKS